MTSIYERYGRKTEQLEEVIEQYHALFQLLKDIKSGKVAIERVDVGECQWKVEEDG